MNSPEVSICIPTYNRQDYILDAIDAARTQSFEDIEIVICDNASTDETQNICEKQAEEDPRISYYRFDTNVGAVGNFNRCIERAQGKYIKFLMSDDLIVPTCVERMLDPIRLDSSITLVSAVQKDTTFDGKIIRVNRLFEETGTYDGQIVAKDLLLQMCNKIGAPTNFLARREDCLDGFRRDLFYSNDFEFSLRLLVKGNLYFLNEELSIIRQHSATMSTAYTKTMLLLADQLKLRDQFSSFIKSQGLSEEQWFERVDETIVGTVDYLLLEEKLTLDDVNENASKLAALIGSEHYEESIRTFANLVFYAFSRLHDLNIEKRWSQGQVKNLEQALEEIKSTKSWRLRKLIEKAFLTRK